VGAGVGGQEGVRRKAGEVEGVGGVAILGVGAVDAVDAGYVDAFLAAALTRVMRIAVLMPVVAAASLLMDLPYVLFSPSRHCRSLTAANWVSFDFNVAYSSC